MKKRWILLIDGPMGAGKSTVTDILKSKLTMTLVTGMDRIKCFVAGFNRTKEENIAVAHIVEAITDSAIKEGLNVIIEQGFMRAEYVKPYIDIASSNNANFFIVQIEAPREILIKRILARPTPTWAKESVSIKRMEKNLDTYFNNKYRDAIVFDSSMNTPEQIAEKIYLMLELKND